jgi:hypothetical protein
MSARGKAPSKKPAGKSPQKVAADRLTEAVNSAAVASAYAISTQNAMATLRAFRRGQPLPPAGQHIIEIALAEHIEHGMARTVAATNECETIARGRLVRKAGA